jgi:MFS family permease
MGSAVLANGGGSIADVIPQERRGAALSMFTLGPLLGPGQSNGMLEEIVANLYLVLGPVCGGFLAAAKGWRVSS